MKKEIALAIALVMAATSFAFAQEGTSPLPPPPTQEQQLTQQIQQADLALMGINYTRAYIGKLWGDLDRDEAVAEKNKAKAQADLEKLKGTAKEEKK